MSSRSRRLLAMTLGPALLVSAMAAACSSSDAAPASNCDGGRCDGGSSGSSSGASGAVGGDAEVGFVAIGSDFQGFESWEKFYLGDSPEAVGVHLAGPKTVYINKRPPKGSTEFPVGTIIVKTIAVGPKSEWQLFAMVKRGNDFNLFGAVGWEWFGLQLFDNDVVKIEWRGWAPPGDAGQYGGGGVVGVCNSCHRTQDTDFVLTPQLSLTTL